MIHTMRNLNINNLQNCEILSILYCILSFTIHFSFYAFVFTSESYIIFVIYMYDYIVIYFTSFTFYQNIVLKSLQV